MKKESSILPDSSSERGYLFPVFHGGVRLGNLLFHIAAVYAHAQRVGSECRIPWDCSEGTQMLRSFLGEYALPSAEVSQDVVYQEPNYSYTPLPEDLFEGGVCGYFQSSKYFRDYEKEIRQIFSPFLAPRQTGTLGIHIRLGDYISPQHSFYQTLGVDYLSRALQCTKARHVVLFSDEPTKAEAILRAALPENKGYELEIDSSSQYEALRRMTSMEELIISASSYSWWAAWLGKPRTVIAPDKWYRYQIENYQDIYEPDWRLLPVYDSKPQLTVAILYICLGKYEIFWKDFYSTFEQNFLPDEKKHYYVITDHKQIAWQYRDNVSVIPWEKKGWPHDTMMRFEAFLSLSSELKQYDYVFWMNANTRCVGKVGREILPSDIHENLVCVKHPYFDLDDPENYTYERNEESTAYIPQGEGVAYVSGGFYGGKPDAFLKLCRTCKRNQDEDAAHGITAIWHDESHLNKYILNKSPLILPDAYLWPEEFEQQDNTKILILDKANWGGHETLRSQDVEPDSLSENTHDETPVKCVILTAPGEIVECITQATELGYEVELYPTTRSSADLADTHYGESAAYLGRTPESAEQRPHVRSLRASFIRALRDTRYRDSEDIIFCESDAVPTIRAEELKQMLHRALSEHPDADILRPFRYCEWRQGIVPVNELPNNASFSRMVQRSNHDPCISEYWGTHALYVPVRSRERLARVFAEYRLPTDVALALANGKNILKIYTSTHNFFYQIHRDRKPHAHRIAGVLLSNAGLRELQRQIWCMMDQDYADFHLFVAARGIDSNLFDHILLPQYRHFIESERLTISLVSKDSPEVSPLFPIQNCDISSYEIFSFIHDEVIYARDYISLINKFHEALPPECCSIYTGKENYCCCEGGKTFPENPINATLAVPYCSLEPCMSTDESPEDVFAHLKAKAINRTSFVEIQRASYPSPKSEAKFSQIKDVRLFIVHPQWKDELILQGGRASRTNRNDKASILSYDGTTLRLKWDNWGEEAFVKAESGRYIFMQNP